MLTVFYVFFSRDNHMMFPRRYSIVHTHSLRITYALYIVHEYTYLYMYMNYTALLQRPQTHHPTVLDMMDIEDLEVRNVLIDQCHIDTVLLIETRLEAERVIEVERPRGASVVSCVCVCVCLSVCRTDQEEPLWYIGPPTYAIL